MEKNLEIARATLEEKFEIPLRGYAYPPRAYVRVECMSCTLSGADIGTYIPCLAIQEGGKGNHQEQVGELIKETAASIDDLSLKMLFITVQQNNLEICIRYAVNEYVLLLSVIASTYSLYLRSVYKDTIVRHFHIIEDIPILKQFKGGLIIAAASWFGHCYDMVCAHIQHSL